MANATQDLVIRMKTDSQNFNDGIEKAKGKIKQFGNEGKGALSSFTGALGMATKAFGALGIAVGAKNIFSDFMHSTESMSDKWNNEIGAMKDGWKDFLWQINTANFKGLDNLISKARKAREEMDALGDANALFNLANFDISAQMEDLLNQIQKKKKKGLDYSNELEQYNKLMDDLKKAAEPKMGKSISSLEALFSRYGFNLGDMGLNGKDANSYLKVAELAREAAAGLYDERIKEYREARDKTATGDLKNSGDFVYSEHHDYLQELKDKRGFAYVEMSRVLSDLADIPTADKEMIDKILTEYYSTSRYITQKERQLNRYLETETPTTKPTENVGGMTTEQQMEYLAKALQNEILNDDRIKDSAIIKVEILDEEIIEPETDELLRKVKEAKEAEEALWNSRITNLNVYGAALNNVSNIFASLNSIINDDSPWKKFTSVLSVVANGITSLISTYTTLIAVEEVAQAVAAGEEIPFPYNLVMIAAAGAAIAAVVSSVASQIKTQRFAGGGIVGGNDYHDGIHANLSTGEMVLNKNQQTRLWNLIMSGGRVNQMENVVFRISGEDLVGTIDNYNKNNSY